MGMSEHDLSGGLHSRSEQYAENSNEATCIKLDKMAPEIHELWCKYTGRILKVETISTIGWHSDWSSTTKKSNSIEGV